MIYVDLDNTLIDSVKRLRGEMEVAARYGFDEILFWKAVDLAFAKHGVSNFGHDALFEACRTIKPGLGESILADWEKVIMTPHLFSDALIFLNRFPKEHLTLVTTGSHKFQRAKIATHNLEYYFSEIRIVPSPKCQHIDPVYPAVYVDDSPREIDVMKSLYPKVFCILVRQPAPWEKQKVSSYADVYCADLISAMEHIL